MTGQRALRVETGDPLQPHRSLVCFNTTLPYGDGRTCRERDPENTGYQWCSFCRFEQSEELDRAWMTGGPE